MPRAGAERGLTRPFPEPARADYDAFRNTDPVSFSAMNLLSRLFRKDPDPAPPPIAAAPPSAPAAPPPPAVDPQEHDQLLRTIASGSVEAAELMRLAVDGATTRVRQAAAAAIDDPALWQELLPRLRGRDKAAYRLVRQRADALLAGQRALEQAALEAATLCASIERHATRRFDGAFPVTLSLLEMRWQALPDSVDAETHERSRQALERCREVVAAQQREVARLAAEREAEEARARTVDAERQALRQAAVEQAADQATAEAGAVAEAEEARAAEAEAQSERRAVQAQAHGEIASLIRLGGTALHRGDTRKAARFRQSIEESLQAAPPLPPQLARGLEQLDARLNELRQWKDYVAAPKRIELIEDMEALVGVDEEPAALAEHIRALRQEWRTLNKGLAIDAPAETERFEQAGRAAFKPCEAHFAGQAAIRRQNLDARQQVLERVLAFEAALDPEQPDHPFIARVLREAPQEWRGHAPVDRDAGRASETEFHRALDRLRARVNAWYARNVDDKQALIAQARPLATAGDAAQAIDVVKRLQAQWKDTGPAPHAQSQSLWEEFRALCTAVYERRQQEFAAQSATLEQAKAQAVALCEQIEQSSHDAPPDRQAGPVKLREWQEAFDAVGELPRAEARGLRDRFERATSRYESLLAGQDQRDAETAEQNVQAAARAVRAWQRAVIERTADDEREALRSAAETCIAGVPRWPNKGTLQALRQALLRTAATGFPGLDDAAREQALRGMCIRAEILSSTATPAEDSALRRDHEMQLLRQGLGQARQVEDRDWEAMRLEWLGIDAVPPAVHDALERRFLQCLARRRPSEAGNAAHRGLREQGRGREQGRDRERGRDQDRGRGGGRGRDR